MKGQFPIPFSVNELLKVDVRYYRVEAFGNNVHKNIPVLILFNDLRFQ